jgi:hypothetical protein
VEGVKLFDLATTPLREVNRFLHRDAIDAGVKRVKILNADGAHSIAAGLNAPLDVFIDGHAGYYAGGMNMHANITVHGNAGPGVGEHDVRDDSRRGLCVHGGEASTADYSNAGMRH